MLTQLSKFRIKLMSICITGDMWAPLVVALGLSLTSSLFGVIVNKYEYIDSLEGGIAAIVIGPTAFGGMLCLVYLLKIAKTLFKRFDMHSVYKMKSRSNNKTFKQMVLENHKTLLYIRFERNVVKQDICNNTCMSIETFVKNNMFNRSAKKKSYRRSKEMRKKVTELKDRLSKGYSLSEYNNVLVVRLNDVLKMVKRKDNAEILCDESYNAYIRILRRSKARLKDQIDHDILEKRSVVNKIVESTGIFKDYKIEYVGLIGAFVDLQNVSDGVRSDWTKSGDRTGWRIKTE